MTEDRLTSSDRTTLYIVVCWLFDTTDTSYLVQMATELSIRLVELAEVLVVGPCQDIDLIAPTAPSLAAILTPEDN